MVLGAGEWGIEFHLFGGADELGSFAGGQAFGV